MSKKVYRQQHEKAIRHTSDFKSPLTAVILLPTRAQAKKFAVNWDGGFLAQFKTVWNE